MVCDRMSSVAYHAGYSECQGGQHCGSGDGSEEGLHHHVLQVTQQEADDVKYRDCWVKGR